MAGMTLVWVDTTMCAVRATAGFLIKDAMFVSRVNNVTQNEYTYRCLLDNNVFDDEILNSQALCIGI